MLKRIIVCLIVPVAFYHCSNDKPLTEEQIRYNDSISKVQQKAHSDSLKKENPLLILPPDSTYTGDYIDKYPNGIIKFKGQFRFGERHGQWLSFYPSGGPWSELHFDKGKREGPNIVYHQNGKIHYSGYYKNDFSDSLWVYYDTSGVKQAKVIYKGGRIIKELPLDSAPEKKVKSVK